MVLADTSVWINHFSRGDTELQRLLTEDRIVIHPFITGELACGNIKNRKEILNLLSKLPSLQVITNEEYFIFLEKNQMYGKGAGFVDIHLLASAVISGCKIYACDKVLSRASEKFGLRHNPFEQ